MWVLQSVNCCLPKHTAGRLCRSEFSEAANRWRKYLQILRAIFCCFVYFSLTFFLNVNLSHLPLWRSVIIARLLKVGRILNLNFSIFDIFKSYIFDCKLRHLQIKYGFKILINFKSTQTNFSVYEAVKRGAPSIDATGRSTVLTANAEWDLKECLFDARRQAVKNFPATVVR